MDRIAVAGVALAAVGAIGLVSMEMIGSARAGPPADREYLFAFSAGSQLRLVRVNPVIGMPIITGSTGAGPARLLACQSVVDATAVALGYRCR